MAFMNWKNDFAVNITSVDEQHKKLLDLLNQMFDSMTVGKGREVLGPILKELLSYTVYHFTNEEDMFKKYAYPGMAEHKKAHDDLTAKVKALQVEFENGNKLISIEVMNFLRDWLNMHILGADKKYSPYLIAKGVH